MTNSEKIKFKELLKKECGFVLKKRSINSNSAMQDSQESANNQEKSSAGDKYETSRAMGQIDRDMYAYQLLETEKDMTIITNLEIDKINQVIKPGSVFEINSQLIFVAIGLGTILVNNISVLVISYKSPLYEQLKFKTVGDLVFFKNENHQIETIF
jgi:hypothetical protein